MANRIWKTAEGSAPLGYLSLRRARPLIAPGVDICSWVFAICLTSYLRYGLHDELVSPSRLGLALAVAIVTLLVAGSARSVYRVRWRIGSFEEISALCRLFLTVTGVLAVVSLLPAHHLIPVTASIASGPLALVLAGTARGAWRLNWERRLRPDTAIAERAVVFGAGEAGSQLVSALLVDPRSRYVPVALLDDDRAKSHFQVRSLRVAGTRSDLRAVAERHQASTVILAIPSANSEVVRELHELATAANLSVKVLPPTTRLLDVPVTAADVKPVTEADLLGRHLVDTDVDSIAGYLKGQRVLVTGAGGSIGSELCRQIALFEPGNLVMLDRDESGLHQVQLSIHGRAMLDTRSLVVCDIRDPDALAAAFAEHRPEVVFHAAALKHLPLLEMWPAEAVKTNVIGTRNVLRAAAAAGATRFVNVSTDKAAWPCSALGYSKRLAERLTATAAQAGSGTYLSVRFGNVLGTRGSVLTAFRAQIASGGPVTVTDPQVTRYFMTVEEAVQLVIQAGAIGRSGEVLVLEMGKAVRIAEVAQRLIDVAGGGINIVYTGLRAGEKMHENLFGEGERGERPIHHLISHVEAPPVDEASLAALEKDLTLPPAALLEVLRQACDSSTVNVGVAEVGGVVSRADE